MPPREITREERALVRMARVIRHVVWQSRREGIASRFFFYAPLVLSWRMKDPRFAATRSNGRGRTGMLLEFELLENDSSEPVVRDLSIVFDRRDSSHRPT